MPRKPIEPYWQCGIGLPSHAKTGRFRDLMRVDFHRAVGLIACFFCGVRQHEPKGDLSHVSDTTIAHWCSWWKKPEVLVEALTEAGFIDREPRRVHNWKVRYARLNGNNIGTESEQLCTEVVPISERDGTKLFLTRAGAETKTKNKRTTTPYTPPKGGCPRVDRSREVADRWNDLAVELFLPTVTLPLRDSRKRAGDFAAANGLLDRWSDFAAALRGPAGSWHRSQKLGFDWLTRKALPWVALIEKHAAMAGDPNPVPSAPTPLFPDRTLAMIERVEREDRERMNLEAAS